MTLAPCTRPPQGAAAAAAAGYRAALPVLETERLSLRAPQVEDFPLWARIFEGPGSEFLSGPRTAEDAWAVFCGYVACWPLHGHGPFTVISKDDGAALGFVFLGIEWEDEEIEQGWFFAEEARGQGYAFEAAVAVRDWALTLLPSFVSYVNERNAPSNALARRLGAVRDEAASARLGANVWRHGRAA